MAHVLVVDDSKFARLTLRTILEEGGHQVSEAENAARGLELSLQLKPDLVTIDLLMPGTSGQELLRQLISHHLPCPVVVVSADIQKATYNEVMEIGAAAFVQKPSDAEEFLETINRLLK